MCTPCAERRRKLRHDSVVNRVKDLYKEAGEDVGKFAEKVKEISFAEVQHEWVLAVRSIKDSWSDLESLRPMDGFWNDAPMLKFMEAFDKLRQNNDFDAFRNVMDDVTRLDPAMAGAAARAQKLADNLEKTQEKGNILHGIINYLTGDTDALGRAMGSAAGAVAGFGGASAAATGQVAGLSNAMRELIGYVPEMAQALKAQDALAKAQAAYQTEVQRLADQFVKNQDTKAYMAGWEEASGALDKARDSITGFTKVSEEADKLLRDANRNALPERAASFRKSATSTRIEIRKLNADWIWGSLSPRFMR